MIFQCKCCGGSLKVEEGTSTGVCEYCGSTMTIPKVDDEKILNLFNRANHLRMKSEFDNARIVYENIVAEDKKNAEAYWGICLCKYGIEYVTDPNTEQMIPTCHRSSFTSILQDGDYASALEYADSVAQGVYREEAAQIAVIQEKLLEVSGKEEPYDIFICYKESDEGGRRTKDSVRAQDLYYELTKKKYRVFFSRISLKGKIGKEYEPYIFSALNSSRIMIVVGTSEENMNAPWVKNEWSRFLSLMKERQDKTLIPVYQDMDPYDMPEEFMHLQALDMSRLGFMQDLLEGISKLLPLEEAEETEYQAAAETNVTPLLQRANIFLEDKEWKKADDYAERVLDLEPKNAEAYVIKLMAERHAGSLKELARQKTSFDNSRPYQKVLQYADSELVSRLQNWNNEIKREAKCGAVYAEAVKLLGNEKSFKNIERAQQLFQSISDYKDASEKQEKCRKKVSELKEREYQQAIAYKQNDTLKNLYKAEKMFNKLGDWKDSETLMSETEQRIKELEEQERRERQAREEQERRKLEKRRTREKRLIAITVFAIVCAGIMFTVYINSDEYLQLRAKEYIEENGGADLALWNCRQMKQNNLKDEIIIQIMYEARAAGDFELVIDAFEEMQDSAKKEEIALQVANDSLAAGKFDYAIRACEFITDRAKKEEIALQMANDSFAAGKIDCAIRACEFITDRAKQQEISTQIVRDALAAGKVIAVTDACKSVTDSVLQQEICIQIINDAIAADKFIVAINTCKTITDPAKREEVAVQIANDAIAAAKFTFLRDACGCIEDHANRQKIYSQCIQTVNKAIAAGRFTYAIDAFKYIPNSTEKQKSYLRIAKGAIAAGRFAIAKKACNYITDSAQKQRLLNQIKKKQTKKKKK